MTGTGVLWSLAGAVIGGLLGGLGVLLAYEAVEAAKKAWRRGQPASGLEAGGQPGEVEHSDTRSLSR